MIVAALYLAQPVARAWGRVATRVSIYRPPPGASSPAAPRERIPFSGWGKICYWSVDWHERTELLQEVLDELRDGGWTVTIDTRRASWDMRIHCSPWTGLQIRTVQEDHGSGKRLIWVRHRLRLTKLGMAVLSLGAAGAVSTLAFNPVPAAASFRPSPTRPSCPRSPIPCCEARAIRSGV
jgi:hypothetical protein